MSLPVRPSVHSHDSQLAPRANPLAPMPVPPAPPREEPLVDLTRVRELLGFPLRAAGRRSRLAKGLAGGVLLATVLAAVFLPRTYLVESRILAQKNVVMPALGNPRRAVPTDSDAPTRLAAEAVMSRENLEQIIRETNLLAHEDEVRSPLGMLRKRVEALMGRPAKSEAERVDVLVEVLRKRLWVTANDQTEGTVSIGVIWPEPRTALAIARVAQDNFLDQRHATEVARIGESISILERYVAGARHAIDSTLEAVSAVPRSPTRGAFTRRFDAPRPVSREVAGLQASLATRRVEIQDLTTSRAQRLADARAQLAELRRSYGPAHPEVEAAEQSIAALSVDSPQLQALRTEERNLRARLAQLGAAESAVAPTGADAMLARAALERLVRADTLDDPRLMYAQSRLKIAIGDYEDLLDRLEGARIELETARAAFKYRYSIVTPAQLPKRPAKPNVPFLLIGGVVVAVALTLFSVTVLDLASGRAIESWQVERQIGLPIIGELDRK